MLVRLLKRILLEKIFCTLIESQLITIDCDYNWNEVNKCTKNVHLRERERERDEGSGIRDKEMGIRMKVDGRSGILYFPSAISLILACKQRPRETTTPPSPSPNLSTSARHRNFVPFPVFPAVFLSLPSPPPPPSFSPGETLSGKAAGKVEMDADFDRRRTRHPLVDPRFVFLKFNPLFRHL